MNAGVFRLVRPRVCPSQRTNAAPSIKQMCPGSPKSSPGAITVHAPNRAADRSAAGLRTVSMRSLPVEVQPGLVLLHFLELGVDDVVFLLARATLRLTPRTGRRACRTLRGLRGLHVGVHLFAELLRRRSHRFDLRFDRGLVARTALQRFFELLQ